MRHAHQAIEPEGVGGSTPCSDAVPSTRLLSPIEAALVNLLNDTGGIGGAANVGYALWPDRDMQAQGAAFAAMGVLSRLQDMRYCAGDTDGKTTTYIVTPLGMLALQRFRRSLVDPRQMSLLD